MADEIHQQHRVAHDDTKRDEADHRNYGEWHAGRPVADQDTDEGERDRRQGDKQQFERAEPRDNKDRFEAIGAPYENRTRVSALREIKGAFLLSTHVHPCLYISIG